MQRIMIANGESRRSRRCVRAGAWAVLASAVLSNACETDGLSSPGEATGPSVAFGIWQPGPTDTCSKEQHDRYAAVGPDGKLYPTWHAAIDPATGCTFGHEHGRDPRGSDLWAEVGPIPFAYANEQLDTFDPLTRRHEDHVGHKVEWENDVRIDFDGTTGAVLDVRCDVLTKLHQGTHSKDAFTNNLHELVYHIRCTDGTAMSVTLMSAIGTPGEFVASCDRDRHVHVGVASPAGSPKGGGKRAIPDRICIERHMLVSAGQESDFHAALRESWETHNQIRTVSGRTVASFDPYFQVFFPSRFFDPAMSGIVGRPIAVCYEVTPSGERASGDECAASTGNGSIAGVAYDDPRSKFNGVLRVVDINGNRIDNEDGPEYWYSDPFGQGARTEAFPGSIRQYIAQLDNRGRQGHGPVLGRNRDYGGPGVRAPN
ncbi:MAG: hypothetical protein ACREL7_16735 [Longimicrobiales bacterium]